MRPLNIFIADDHELIRKAIKELLSKTSGFCCAGEARHGTELLEMIKEASISPDIVLLDLRMPYPTNIKEFIQELKKQDPDIKVVAFSSYFNPTLLQTLVIEMDIEGYILKEGRNYEIIEALEKIAQGEKYYYHSIYPRILDLLKKEEEFNKLTKRETEVFQLINDQDKEIAKQLGITIHTVRKHLNEIKRKLNLETRFEILKFAMKYNSITGPISIL